MKNLESTSLTFCAVCVGDDAAREKRWSARVLIELMTDRRGELFTFLRLGTRGCARAPNPPVDDCSTRSIVAA